MVRALTARSPTGYFLHVVAYGTKRVMQRVRC